MTAKKRPKKFNGQRNRAGRLSLKGRALNLAVCALCLLFAMAPGASTLNDGVQRFVQTMLASKQTQIAKDPKAASLLREVVSDADAVRDFSRAELAYLFGTPSLVRREGGIETVQYASGICAIDLYFKDGAAHPAYAEYRLQDAARGHHVCVQSLYLGARPVVAPAETPRIATTSGGRV